MVAKQLHGHLSQHQLYEKHQSAYRKRHSTETALTRVQNDILRAMDDSKATVLVLLDLSAAFDTVDHNFLLESSVVFLYCACNIGVMFDHHMHMTTYVTKMCQAAWFQLRNIRSVRSSLTKEATLRLVCSLVMHRLDYGNISLYGMSEGLLDKFQKAQNAAARQVVKCLRSDHITPHLRDLHWLPVRSRIKYKILVTTWQAPAYISEMLTPYTPPRTLISTDTSLLTVSTTHTKHRDRAFSCAAPRLWNELPISIKTVPPLLLSNNQSRLIFLIELIADAFLLTV